MNIIIKLKKVFSTLKKDYKELSEQEKVISDAWLVMETIPNLTYAQAVEILKILKPEGKNGEN